MSHLGLKGKSGVIPARSRRCKRGVSFNIPLGFPGKGKEMMKLKSEYLPVHVVYSNFTSDGVYGFLGCVCPAVKAGHFLCSG